MVWLVNNQDEGNAIRELNELSDRAAAIVGAVLLENCVDRALRQLLRDHKKSATRGSVHDEMFQSGGPLGSFRARNDLAFMLGLYSAGVWGDIDTIRDIRNDFAHDLSITSFNSQSIRARCENIRWFERHVFETQEAGKMAPLDVRAKLFEGQLPELLSDPRKRYLLAIRFYTGAIFSQRDVHTGRPLVDPYL